MPGGDIDHVIAVTSLDGTGKTQLVLRYIEEHGGKSTPILGTQLSVRLA